MGVFYGSLTYNCDTDTTQVVVHSGPGTPDFVQKVNFKLFPNQPQRYTMNPNDMAIFVVPGKVTELTVTRIDFFWHDANGDHYAVHPDTTLVYNGEQSCSTTTTFPVVTTPKPPPSTVVGSTTTTTVVKRTTTTKADNRCEEDEDCWNCNTMGNHICGSVETLPPTGSSQNTSHTLPILGSGLTALGTVAVIFAAIVRRFASN